MRRMHDRAVDHHVVVDELRRPGAVGEDAANGAGDEEDVVRSVGLEPVRHLGLVAKIELVSLRREDVGEALRLESPDDRGTNQPRMAGYIDASLFVHESSSLRIDVVHPAEIQARVIFGLAVDHYRGGERMDRRLIAQHQVISVAKIEPPGKIDMDVDGRLWGNLQIET